MRNSATGTAIAKRLLAALRFSKAPPYTKLYPTGSSTFCLIPVVFHAPSFQHRGYEH
jgi:hypothetical protein